MKQPNDIIERIIDRMRVRHPEIPASEWEHIRRENRIAEGGERHYVWKEVARGKAFSLAECLAAGLPIAEARKTLGLHERTCRRYLRRRWVNSY